MKTQLSQSGESPSSTPARGVLSVIALIRSPDDSWPPTYCGMMALLLIGASPAATVRNVPTPLTASPALATRK